MLAQHLLLLSLDRLSRNELTMTDEPITNMPGVRREEVTATARTFQERRLISYRRGDGAVLDRAGPDAAACACYQVVRDMYDGERAVAAMHETPLAALAQ